MDIKISVKVITPDGTLCETEVLCLEKACDSQEAIGLSISEGKDLLQSVQEQIVQAQCKAHTSQHSVCGQCGSRLRSKGTVPIRYRTVFGDINLKSPRFYYCKCAQSNARTFSPLKSLLPDHIAPELTYLETKWASLVSFGVTVDLLKEVLPISASLCAESVRNHLHKSARRLEAELGEEQLFFVETSQSTRAALPVPEGPITVGIDGGYVRCRDNGQSHFEVVVGKSIPQDRPDRYLGLVQTHDAKPRRRLHKLLKDQGWQENQCVTFMTDGGDSVRDLAWHMAPASEHILDWFHITMRLTVIGQYVKGLNHVNPKEGEQIGRLLRQIKGYLWNGNLHEGKIVIEDLTCDLEEIETSYASIKALRKAAAEFQTYIENNADMIPNYAERRRYGERVSTGFVESTVNAVVGKRFGKKQQMRWSKSGAHLLLQTRTRALDGTLRQKFEQWYPGMKCETQDPATDKLAA
ncbi:ISKra4 family transposase [Pseudovibrio ascidiaceicola]|uniref:ISKra4 family transposase n=1 Tax=Pseudovibrio ascidiaceicola TaxID=285279 RepID=UPI003D362527